jgi:uncharacterized membrane protein (DUF373 family)
LSQGREDGATRQAQGLAGRFEEFRRQWMLLGLYERFERVVAAVLTWVVAVIVLMALYGLVKEVARLMLTGTLDPLDYKTFHLLFGQILTMLIALEFNHSIIKAGATGRSMIQVSTVLLIAIMAVARKFVLLDVDAYSAGTISALAAVVLSLGAAYWLVRERARSGPAASDDHSL